MPKNKQKNQDTIKVEGSLLDDQPSKRRNHNRYRSLQAAQSKASLNSNRFNRDTSQTRINLPSVGPGEYNLPRLFESYGPQKINKTPQGSMMTTFNASNPSKQHPSYTFGSRLNQKRVINTKALQDFQGKDSPGPAAHDAFTGGFGDIELKKALKTKHKQMNQKKGSLGQLSAMTTLQSPENKGFGCSSSRFFQFNATTQHNQQIPCQYATPKKTNSRVLASLQNTATTNMNPAFNKVRIYESSNNQTFFGIPVGGTRGPGPGNYNTDKYSAFIDHDIASMSMSKIIAKKSGRGSMTIEPDRFGMTKKVFCKEYAKDKMGVKVPGPSEYKIEPINKKGQVKHSIPSTDRKLLTIVKDDGPSPAFYNHLATCPSQVSFKGPESQTNNN